MQKGKTNDKKWESWIETWDSEMKKKTLILCECGGKSSLWSSRMRQLVSAWLHSPGSVLYLLWNICNFNAPLVHHKVWNSLQKLCTLLSVNKTYVYHWKVVPWTGPNTGLSVITGGPSGKGPRGRPRTPWNTQGGAGNVPCLARELPPRLILTKAS